MMSLAPSILDRLRWGALPGFHRFMSIASLAVIAVSVIGCPLTLIEVPDAALILPAVVVMIAAMLPLPAYWHERGKTELRDAALTIPWALLLMCALPCTVGVAGRLGMNIALQDARFLQWDQSLGVSVPGIMAWAPHHWLGNFANRIYYFLFSMLLVSYLLPALTGKVRAAQQFITSNLIAFAIGLPLFAFFPAVGPWYGYHLPASSVQAVCQHSLLLLRTPGPYKFQLFGVVCFPSFHTIWALLGANALWCFKPLRIPAALFAGLILLSTMTTGWHYFVDVFAGMVVAAAAIAGARWLSCLHNP
jgi:membrane-associated phospholipid phosphatase